MMLQQPCPLHCKMMHLLRPTGKWKQGLVQSPKQSLPKEQLQCQKRAAALQSPSRQVRGGPRALLPARTPMATPRQSPMHCQRQRARRSIAQHRSPALHQRQAQRPRLQRPTLLRQRQSQPKSLRPLQNRALPELSPLQWVVKRQQAQRMQCLQRLHQCQAQVQRPRLHRPTLPCQRVCRPTSPLLQKNKGLPMMSYLQWMVQRPQVP